MLFTLLASNRGGYSVLLGKRYSRASSLTGQGKHLELLLFVYAINMQHKSLVRYAASPGAGKSPENPTQKLSEELAQSD